LDPERVDDCAWRGGDEILEGLRLRELEGM
jgi:hypothetical protein